VDRVKYIIQGELDQFYSYNVDLTQRGSTWTATVARDGDLYGTAESDRLRAIAWIAKRTVDQLEIFTLYDGHTLYEVKLSPIKNALANTASGLQYQCTVTSCRTGSVLETSWFDTEQEAREEALSWIM